MTESLNASERYLLRLANGLEALGPAETSEVLAEIGSHLAEATMEANGDESVALAHFGSPEVLATRILEERGVLIAGPALPLAPAWRRWAAHAVDVAIWTAVFLFAAAVPVTIYFWGPAARTSLGSLNPLWLVLLWFLVAAVAAAAAWWAIRQRRQWGHTTTGMRALGLRRIQVGQTTRIVKRLDVPGLIQERRPRVLAIGATLLAAAVLGFFLYSLFTAVALTNRVNGEMEVRSAVSNVEAAVGIVTQVYQAVSAGTPEKDLELFGFAPSAKSAAADLVERRAAGKIDQYFVSLAPGTDYTALTADTASFHIDSGDDRTIAIVTVPVIATEYGRTPGDYADYEYLVTWVNESHDDGSLEGYWLIQSVQRLDRLVDSTTP
jgi:hypothetical protein